MFLFEIPTGVVADRWSRKWSVIIGHAGIGLGFLIEASAASFPGVLAGQAVWGIAYTFTSGATVAWVAGELTNPTGSCCARLFLRVQPARVGRRPVAVPLSFVLGINVSLRAPLFIGGVLSIALGGVAVPGDGRGPLRAGRVGAPLDVAGDGIVGRRRCAGDPGQPRPARSSPSPCSWPAAPARPTTAIARSSCSASTGRAGRAGRG